MEMLWKLGGIVVTVCAVVGCGGSSVNRTVRDRTVVSQSAPETVKPGVPGDDERGFITLFDGTSTKGWAIYIQPGHKAKMHIDGQVKAVDAIAPFQDAFYIEDGAIACKGYGYHWFRYEAREFGDFVLRLQFKIAKDTNSGVCLRTTREGEPPVTGFEVQIEDDIGKDPNKNSTGAIYDVVTPMYNASKPIGEWNDMEITCDGPLVKVVLNGLKVIDTDFSKLTKPIGKFKTPYAELPRSGYIALQDHWTPIWYRNIRIKSLR